jgi:hypothetical protein
MVSRFTSVLMLVTDIILNAGATSAPKIGKTQPY